MKKLSFKMTLEFAIIFLFLIVGVSITNNVVESDYNTIEVKLTSKYANTADSAKIEELMKDVRTNGDNKIIFISVVLTILCTFMIYKIGEKEIHNIIDNVIDEELETLVVTNNAETEESNQNTITVDGVTHNAIVEEESPKEVDAKEV